MTKINKLGKSTFVIAILSFILVAVLAFGGTYAYFSSVSGRAAGKVTTGHLTLAVSEDDAAVSQINGYTIASNKIVQPGQRLVGAGNKDEDGNWTLNETSEEGADVNATVTSNINYYLRVKFDVKVITGKINAEGKWEADSSKSHNGIITPDDLLDTEDTARTETEDEGDYVDDDIAILEIFLKVNKNTTGATEWKELDKSWQWVDPDGEGAQEATRQLVDGHTGYFYAGAHDKEADLAKHSAPIGKTDDGKDAYEMEVLINVHDWVGAYGCTYYMDAAIEIHFQIEVLQADYLDNTKLGLTWGDGSATAPTTIAELHEAWDKAVNYAQAEPKDLEEGA